MPNTSGNLASLSGFCCAQDTNRCAQQLVKRIGNRRGLFANPASTARITECLDFDQKLEPFRRLLSEDATVPWAGRLALSIAIRDAEKPAFYRLGLDILSGIGGSNCITNVDSAHAEKTRFG